MERFCDKCGSLVNGEGEFCPFCGAAMSSVFRTGGGVDLTKQDAVPPVSGQVPYPTGSAPIPANNTYQGQSNYMQPVYPQGNLMQSQTMTVGEWVATIILTGIPIVGIILLFVWAFTDTPQQSKKNYARAMLILQAVGIVFSFIFVPIMVGFLGVMVDDIFGALVLPILPI